MQKVSVFETTDGRLFKQAGDAARHEAEVKLIKWINDAGPAIETDIVERLADSMIENAEGIYTILSCYLREAPMVPPERVPAGTVVPM